MFLSVSVTSFGRSRAGSPVGRCPAGGCMRVGDCTRSCGLPAWELGGFLPGVAIKSDLLSRNNQRSTAGGLGNVKVSIHLRNIVGVAKRGTRNTQRVAEY
jgi:hypothetical protein